MEYNLKHYAHIGDAVWELYVREFVIQKTLHQKDMHKLTTNYVRAEFQANILDSVQDFLNEDEKELVRRARNLPITINKRNNPVIHRCATSFEVLIGFWYLNDKKRLEEFYLNIKKYLIS